MNPITPQQEPGKKKALALTVTVHLALIGALLYGVHWKSSQPDAVEVELWSSRPAPAAALPPPPPPPEPKHEPKPAPKPEPKPIPKPEAKLPVKPDIAIKEEKKPPKPEPRPEPEPKKPEPPKLNFDDELKREQKQLEAQRFAKAQADRESQLRAQAEAEQRAAASKRGLLDYANKIKMKIRSKITLPPSIQGNPEAVFEVNQLPTGEVLTVKLKKSSGNAALDAAIERAIYASSPLPKPDDPSLFQRTLEIKHKPFEE